MLATLRNKLKWSSTGLEETRNFQKSYILSIYIGLLEDILLWKNKWLSLSFLILVNTFIIVSAHQEITFLEFFFYASITLLSIDALEIWLKYKHRTACLKRLANHDATKLITVIKHLNDWAAKKWSEYLYLREKNHTKAFLMVNICLGLLFIVGKHINGYLLIHLICMAICLFYKLAPPLSKLLQKIQANAESDVEYEGLIPEVTELDVNLLSLDPEPNPVDERQSLDYWKPHDLAIDEASDSSDNSSSLVTNLSVDKMQSLDKDMETSDSSEDEYTPIEQKTGPLQSTLEIVNPKDTWSGSAYNALWNLTEAVTNMVYTKPEDSKRKRVSSIDSSDGFEMIDQNDLL